MVNEGGNEDLSRNERWIIYDYMNVGSLADLVSDYFISKHELTKYLPAIDSLSIALLYRITKTVLKVLDNLDCHNSLMPISLYCLVKPEKIMISVNIEDGVPKLDVKLNCVSASSIRKSANKFQIQETNFSDL